MQNSKADQENRNNEGIHRHRDVEIDDEGRPWIALAHNTNGELGIVGTYVTGPALYGDLRMLPEITPGGPMTL